jgi:hypothetical protein
VLKYRLDLLKRQIASENAERRNAAYELERIRRHRVPPFTVPPLVDAFITVSDMADKMTDSGNTRS